MSSTQEARLDDLSHALTIRSVWKRFVAQPMAFKLTCLYIFLEFVRPQSIFPSLQVIPFSMLAVVLGIVALLPGISKVGRTKSIVTPLIAVYFVVAAISLAFAEFPGYGLERWDYLLPWFVIYLLIINSTTSRERVILLLLVYSLCNLKLTQYGLRTWLASGGTFPHWGLRGPGGWFANSGELAIQTAMFTTLAMAWTAGLWNQVGRLGRLLLLLVVLSALVTTIGTHSRGGILALGAGVLWMLVAMGLRLRTLVAVGILVAVGVALIGEETWSRFKTVGDDVTSIRRETFFHDGLQIIGDHPVIGIGYFNWMPHYQKYFPPVDDIDYLGGWQLPHNILIQCAAELGVVGLLVFLALVMAFLVTNARTRRLLQPDDRLFRLFTYALDAGMVAFLVAGQFVTVLYYPYFWISLAFAVALHESVRRGAASGTHASGNVKMGVQRHAPGAKNSDLPVDVGTGSRIPIPGVRPARGHLRGNGRRST